MLIGQLSGLLLPTDGQQMPSITSSGSLKVNFSFGTSIVFPRHAIPTVLVAGRWICADCILIFGAGAAHPPCTRARLRLSALIF